MTTRHPFKQQFPTYGYILKDGSPIEEIHHKKAHPSSGGPFFFFIGGTDDKNFFFLTSL